MRINLAVLIGPGLESHLLLLVLLLLFGLLSPLGFFLGKEKLFTLNKVHAFALSTLIGSAC